jgi:hypothetical protein
MRKVIAIASAITLILGLPAVIAAQAKPEPPKAESKAPASIAGKWTLSLDPGSGPLQLPMELKMDGKKVTGTVIGPQGEAVNLSGEYADGKITFAVTPPDGNVYSFKGASKEDGSMAGTVAGPDGSEIAWSATRVKEK